MPASFPTSAKTFTTKSDGAGNTILAAHINDLQAEVTAIESCLLGGTAFNAVITGTITSGAIFPTSGTFSQAVTAQSTVAITGNSTSGCLAVAGDFYNHVLVSAGLNANPLTANHQVCYYGALQANSNVDGVNGFVCAFESAIGLAAGAYTVGKMAAFAVGAFGPFGAGAAATRTWNVSCYPQTAGVNNAVIAMWDATFSGNWFIYYNSGGLASSLAGGDLVLPTECYRSTDTGFLRLAGGSTGGGGGLVALFGSTHATTPSGGQLHASGGWSVIGTLSLANTYSIKIGGTAARATTAGTNRLDLFDGTAPAGTLANGVSFYSASGEARVMDAAGNSTLLSPHDHTPNWVFKSENSETGKKVRIEVEKLLERLNAQFGEAEWFQREGA